MVCMIVLQMLKIIITLYRTDHPCSNKETSVTFKKMELGKLPQILCIQLVRFKKYLAPTPIPGFDTPTSAPTTTQTQSPQTMIAEKIDTRVNVPTELDLSALVSHPVKYYLLAVCNHHGSSPSSGHYTALFLSGGIWWYASDETVREAHANEFEDITPSNSYLLFYEQNESV
jgi:ubiquitin C-terminal hydrolase